MTRANPTLNNYIEALLERFFMEDFADTTRPVKRPSQVAPAPQQKQPFDINVLKQQKGVEQVMNYAEATLGPRIGEGEGRSVYKIGDGNVLKVAKNNGGIGQNQAEATVCASDGNALSLFPKVSQKDPGGLWLITEEAAPMDEGSFQKLTGLPWQVFVSALKGAYSHKTKGISEFDKQNYIQASRNGFFSNLLNVINDCKYEPGDIAKLDSWGIVRGKPVIIDSGFTEAVNQAYYQKGA